MADDDEAKQITTIPAVAPLLRALRVIAREQDGERHRGAEPAAITDQLTDRVLQELAAASPEFDPQFALRRLIAIAYGLSEIERVRYVELRDISALASRLLRLIDE